MFSQESFSVQTNKVISLSLCLDCTGLRFWKNGTYKQQQISHPNLSKKEERVGLLPAQ